jgi:hypothetical protein
MAAQTIDYAALAQQARGGGAAPPPVDYAALAAQARGGAAPGSGGLPANLTANPNGQGTYKMIGPQGQVTAVPFGNVRAAQDQHYAVHPDDAARYQKDAGGAPVDTASRAFGTQPVSDTLAVVGQHLKNLVAGPYHALTDPATPDEMGIASAGGPIVPPQAALAIHRMIVKPTLSGIQTFQDQAAKGNTSLTAPEYDAQGNYTPTAGSGLLDAIPLAGPWARQIENDAHQHGAVPALSGLGTDIVAPHLAGAGLKAVAGAAAGVAPSVGEAVSGAARSVLAPGLDEPIPGAGGLTPRARYAAAKSLGVQLDAADAAGGGVLPIAKTGNIYSTTARGVYGKTLAGNVQALSDATDGALDGMSPLDADAGGRLIQDRLKADHAALHQDASAGFKYLDEATGGAPVPGAATVGQAAQKILADNRDFFSRYPSMAPNSALSVIKDVAKIGDTASYSELQRVRSNILDSIRSNPDLVKDQSTAWLQQLASNLDNVITDKGLTPEQARIFRDANQKWTDLKGSYDNPANPLKYAITSPTPSKLALGVGGKTPEAVADLAPRVGPEGMGVVQRGVTKNLLGNTKDGEYNLGGFGRKYYGLPDAYREALYTPEQQEKLGAVASTANAIGKDLNPSGTAKVGIPAAEFGELGSTLLPALHGNVLPAIGTLAYHGAQYGLARLINSPGFADWLMDYQRSGGEPGAPPVGPTIEGERVPLAPVGPVAPAAAAAEEEAKPVGVPLSQNAAPAAVPVGAPVGRMTAAEVKAESDRLSGPLKAPWWSQGRGVGSDEQSVTPPGNAGAVPAVQPVPQLAPPTLDTVAPAALKIGGPGALQAGNRLPGLDGSDTLLHTPNATLPAKYRAVEADTLIPSHDAMNFAPNPAYPDGVQERDYAGQRENQLRVITNARNYKPEMTVTDNPDGVNGPPVVTPDGIVLGGNSRVMSTQRLYANTANPQVPDGSAYKNFLAARAPSFGLDPNAIAGMKKPVLVREVSPEGGIDGMRRLGSDLNKSMNGSHGRLGARSEHGQEHLSRDAERGAIDDR